MNEYGRMEKRGYRYKYGHLCLKCKQGGWWSDSKPDNIDKFCETKNDLFGCSCGPVDMMPIRINNHEMIPDREE